jgi:hypothetical protein
MFKFSVGSSANRIFLVVILMKKEERHFGQILDAGLIDSESYY